MGTKCHKYRVPVSEIANFLMLLDPGESALVEYRIEGGEHYVVELTTQCELDCDLGVVIEAA